uniref:Zinc finger PHD-type domain-containing protein n=1 Tax=Rhizophora mucronata TaxID=61149 RepID=A0A2P2LJB8_RHIMU
MKGRSHRLQSHDAAHEDWVDGSWTVDCVCGVNFDDGEEMVNCDECGVWVHTRCSRYVKGDELFTCDKCKSKNNNRNDNEETEVAQLLVELPTTTIHLETRNAANGPSHRPFRLWTDIPMEKRVHVQGIPGGDPSLFTELSSVFTPQLWKCTGYVPKKFNFQYREFPCWDEKGEGDAVVNEVENQNTVDKGAGVLFSLSKENVSATSAAALIDMRGTDEQDGCDEKVHLKQMKKWGNEIAEVRHLQIGVKKDRSLLQPIVIQSGKRKSEEMGMPKNHSRKKNSRAAEKEVELNRKGLHDAKSVFTSTSDGKPLEFYEDRGSKSFGNDSQSPKNKNVMETIFQGCESDSCIALGHKAEKPRDNLALAEYSAETLSVEMPRNIFPVGTRHSEGKGRCEVLMGFDNPPKVNLVTLSDLEHVDVGRTPVKQEGDSMLRANLDGIGEGSAGSDVKADELAPVTLEVEDSQINEDCGTFPTLQPDVKVAEADHETKVALNCPSFTDAKHADTSNSMPENSKQNDATFSGSPLTDHKSQKTLEAISESHAEKVQELTDKTCLLKQDLDGSENSIPMLKCLLESKQSLGFTEEPSKSGGANLNSPALPNTVNPNLVTKQQVTMDSNSSIKKDRGTSSVARDDDNMSIKITKERSKSSINSASKMPNSSKTAPIYLPKRILPDSKDSLLCSSSKASLAQNSSETAGLLGNDSASHTQHKRSTSGLPLRSEKFLQSNSQASSKSNHTSSMNPSAPANSPAALSDEELALLLHQELNSSPRVPRVPRVRHASSLHQLASPMATSMLMKRTYSAGTKDSVGLKLLMNMHKQHAGVHFCLEYYL